MLELIKLIKLHFKSLLVILSMGLHAQEKVIYILHTNNTNGALENCYCPDKPYGAVEKRSVFVKEFMQKNPNSILVDSGDIFTMSKQFLKDSLMAEAYNLLPYDAILLGDQEITMDQKHLKQFVDIMDKSIVSTNLKTERSVKSIIVDRNGLKVGIIGILDEYAIKYYPQEIKEKIDLMDPYQEINSELNKLKNKTDIVVLLTHQGADKDVEMAKKLKDVDLIVGSHSQSLFESPEEFNNTLVVQAGKSGYQIGIVKISFSNGNVSKKEGRVDTMKLSLPDDPRIMSLINEYENRSGRINRNKLKRMNKKEPMENLIETLSNEPIYLAIAVVFSIIILLGVLKKLLKIVLVFSALFILWIAYSVWSGKEVSLDDIKENLQSGVENVKKSTSEATEKMKENTIKNIEEKILPKKD